MASTRITKRSVSVQQTGGSSGAANNLFTLACATTLTGLSVQGFVNVFAADATDAQSRSAVLCADVVNKAGTLTLAGTITGSTNVAASAGTLTVAATPTASGTTATFLITPTTSLTATSLVVRAVLWLVQSNGGNITLA